MTGEIVKPDAKTRKPPTECAKCKRHVTATMEAEARMILVRGGPGAARAFFDEKLEDVHASH